MKIERSSLTSIFRNPFSIGGQKLRDGQVLSSVHFTILGPNNRGIEVVGGESGLKTSM